MKRFTQFLCVIMVLSVVLVNPVFASETTARGSSFFASRLAYLNVTSGTTFRAWIEVMAVGTMDKLGASEITIQRSSDNSNWTDVKTYTKEAYPNLVATSDFTHEAYVTYTGTSGYYYRATGWFYAKKGNNTGEYSFTTSSIYLN